MENTKEYWLDFIKNNELNGNLDSMIKESWLRCKKVKRLRINIVYLNKYLEYTY